MPKEPDICVDYYAVLGVSPSATLEEIKAAFRKASHRCHPDRPGGSHEQMVALLEAYEILSDPEIRAVYDLIRQTPHDPTALQTWEPTAARAAARTDVASGNYPRNWGAFQTWFDSFVGDVSATTYGTRRQGQMIFPTASGWTGRLFILIGAIGGGILCLRYQLSAEKAPGPETPLGTRLSWAIGFMVTAALGGWGGAWVGKWAHAAVKHVVTQRNGGTAATAAPVRTYPACEVIPCGTCGQKLRLPNVGGDIILRCPQCGTRTPVRLQPAETASFSGGKYPHGGWRHELKGCLTVLAYIGGFFAIVFLLKSLFPSVNAGDHSKDNEFWKMLWYLARFVRLLH